MTLLGLTHAEKMVNVLIGDITDQKEREEYYEMPVNSNGESMNQVRFKAASELAAATTTFLYCAAAMATLYVLACFGLLFGTLKYKHEGIAPWLVLQIFYETVLISCAYFGLQYNFREMLGQHIKCFCKLYEPFVSQLMLCLKLLLLPSTGFLVAVNIGVDFLNWLVVFCFYRILKEMKELTKSATVWIPCPQPGNVRIFLKIIFSVNSKMCFSYQGSVSLSLSLQGKYVHR